MPHGIHHHTQAVRHALITFPFPGRSHTNHSSLTASRSCLFSLCTPYLKRGVDLVWECTAAVHCAPLRWVIPWHWSPSFLARTVVLALYELRAHCSFPWVRVTCWRVSSHSYHLSHCHNCIIVCCNRLCFVIHPSKEKKIKFSVTDSNRGWSRKVKGKNLYGKCVDKVRWVKIVQFGRSWKKSK